MAKVYGYYEYDESLEPGRSEDGGLSQLLFNSEGKLSAHASFHPEDSDEDHDNDATSPSSDSDSDWDSDAEADALLILAAILAAAGGFVLVRKATPHVQRMIDERALPAVRSFWKKLRGQRNEPDSRDVDEESALVVRTSPVLTGEAAPGAELEVTKPQMSPDEWYARFRAMFEARKFADEQWKLLFSVQFSGDNAIAELQREMTRSRPEAVVRQVTRILEATPETDVSAKVEPMPIAVERDPDSGSE